ncbi:glycogen synthase [Caminibacter sp.]
MNILFSISEMVPFVKTGGLADVGGALPKALRKLGHNVKVVLPRYYDIDKSKLELIPGALGVEMGSLGTLWAGVYKKEIDGVEVYFIDYEEFFGRKGLYTSEYGDSYEDNDKRFVFFSKAALVLAKKINFKPDIIHSNDWHTAAQPILLNTSLRGDEFFRESVSVFTIHNLQHQGVFDKRVMDYLAIGWEHFNPLELEAMGSVNLMKGAIYHAESVNTVSKTYAHEIQTPAFGFGLDSHIRAHNYKLFGIINGVDYEEWDPKIDKYIPYNYDIGSIDRKKLNKLALQERFNFEKNENIPLIGFVGRLVEQKGIGLIAAAIEGILDMGVQVMLLGSGEKWAEGFFSNLTRHPNFRCYIGYSNELAHLIEAASDMFLMPSLFEPCGLNQIYSMKYGTLPIVRGVGGLEDTVENYNPVTKEGCGFKFYEASPHALYNTVKWAVETYYDKDSFRKLQINAMKKHFGWEDSAKDYENLYLYTIYNKKVEKLR